MVANQQKHFSRTAAGVLVLALELGEKLMPFSIDPEPSWCSEEQNEKALHRSLDAAAACQAAPDTLAASCGHLFT